MGGAFLSQPVTTKKVNKYQHGKLRVVTCEMQGRTAKIQDGVNTWRMHWSSIASTRRYSSLLSSTDTVVSRSHSSAPKTYLRYSKGQKVSKRETTPKLSSKQIKPLMTCWQANVVKNCSETSPSKTDCNPSKIAMSQILLDAQPTFVSLSARPSTFQMQGIPELPSAVKVNSSSSHMTTSRKTLAKWSESWLQGQRWKAVALITI
jgi:hypothetical protein